MRKMIYQVFYGMSLHNVMAIMAVFAFVWRIFGKIFEKNRIYRKYWKFGNCVMAVGMIAVIIVVTLTSRSEVTEVILVPFHSLSEAGIQPEIYRSMLMNVFLFFPLGLTLPYAFPEKWKCFILSGLILTLFFSMSIEYIQYYFRLGRAEIDDVLCNMLGYLIGGLSYPQHNN